MTSVVCKYVRILLLIGSLSLNGIAGQSPCPNYFRYVRGKDFEVLGEVEIPSPPRNIILHLKIGLSVATTLPSKYVGRLELQYSKEESVRAVQQGKSLFYRIHFPVQRPLPVLTGLWFNEQLYCSGPRANGRIITSIVLEHTLFPPGVLPLSQDQGNSIDIRPNFEESLFPPFQPPLTPSPPSPLPTTFYQPVQTPPITPIPQWPPSTTTNTQIVQDCGRANTHSINLLIARGSKTSPGQWPWLVAIFVVRIEFEFQCAGSLLTNKHIVTAAHCMKLDNMIVPASTLLVSLGRYRLRNWREKGSFNREVQEYRLHPDYKGDYTDQGSADADLAIIVLREAVEFSTFVRPVCLWSGSTDLRDIVGVSGFVVGWGKDEFGNRYVSEPRMAKVPIVSQENCLWSNAGFVAFTSNRTFCAGERNGSGPCNGDSGSGLMIRDNKEGIYQLRGIVSRSVYDKATLSCDLTQYVVYVDVAKHLDWIREQIVT